MSTLAEKVRAEAEAAELENPDEPTEPEPDPDDDDGDEQTAQAPVGPSDADLKRYESENTRHERALEKIVGSDWEHFAACGVCGGVGFTPAAIDTSTPLQHDPHTETCQVCLGYGATLSGAKPPAQVEIPCNECGGKGWNRLPEHVADTPAPYFPAPGEQAPETPAANGGAVDPRVAQLQAEGFIVVAPVTFPAAAA